jgi:hypothetical protein
LPHYRRERAGDVRIDWMGAVLVALLLGGFQTFIEAVPKDGLTTGNLILAALVAACAAALLACERRATHPIAGLEGPALLDAARHVLVQSIHIGVVLTGCAALAAVFVVRRISHITFRRG